jgi:predicted phage terminase large subunit-like protein
MDGRDVQIFVEQEPGSGGKESAEATIRNLAGFTVKADRVTGDKVTRAEPFAAQAGGRNVKLVKADWNRGYLDRLMSFPHGAYKDDADASSGAFNNLSVFQSPSSEVVKVDTGIYKPKRRSRLWQR